MHSVIITIISFCWGCTITFFNSGWSVSQPLCQAYKPVLTFRTTSQTTCIYNLKQENFNQSDSHDFIRSQWGVVVVSHGQVLVAWNGEPIYGRCPTGGEHGALHKTDTIPEIDERCGDRLAGVAPLLRDGQIGVRTEGEEFNVWRPDGRDVLDLRSISLKLIVIVNGYLWKLEVVLFFTFITQTGVHAYLQWCHLETNVVILVLRLIMARDMEKTNN